MRYLTFALTKGRLASKTLDMLEKLGITCDEMKDKNSRKLIFTNEELGLRFFLAKGPDVPTYVEYGAADIGVVGKDTIIEEGRKVHEVLDLGFGKCRMCVCGREETAEKLQHHELIRVATKYPNIAKDYFYNKKHQTVEIVKLNGSIELAPIVGLSEVIVDIVETGSTLKENGLVVLEEVCPLSARMIVNPVSMRMENDRIKELITNLRNLLREELLKRSPNSYGKYEASVQQILNDVKEKGDEALFGYTEKFDGVKLDASQILVTDAEIEEAYTEVGEELLGIIRKALVNIRTYHEKQMQYSWFDSKPDGTILGQKVTALQRVGVYVPGGKAAYPSSVLMNIMPAKVAGVDEIIMVTPPGKDGKVTPTTLVAAKEAGADKVYKVGGAQAIGALAYGT